jgi:hypothetical protein
VAASPSDDKVVDTSTADCASGLTVPFKSLLRRCSNLDNARGLVFIMSFSSDKEGGTCHVEDELLWGEASFAVAGNM